MKKTIAVCQNIEKIMTKLFGDIYKINSSTETILITTDTKIHVKIKQNGKFHLVTSHCDAIGEFDNCDAVIDKLFLVNRRG